MQSPGLRVNHLHTTVVHLRGRPRLPRKRQDRHWSFVDNHAASRLDITQARRDSTDNALQYKTRSFPRLYTNSHNKGQQKHVDTGHSVLLPIAYTTVCDASQGHSHSWPCGIRPESDRKLPRRSTQLFAPSIFFSKQFLSLIHI